jgi:hypothetical protein
MTFAAVAGIWRSDCVRDGWLPLHRLQELSVLYLALSFAG